jgi:hypothetical protein
MIMSNDQICLALSGPVADTSFLSNWKRFKDNLRRVVKEQIRRVEVGKRWIQTNYGWAEIGYGWAQLEDQDDGERALGKPDPEAEDVSLQLTL